MMLSEDDIKAWKEVVDKLKQSRRKRFAKNEIKQLPYILDLHGYGVQEAYDSSLNFIMQHIQVRSKYITIITGKGTDKKEGLIHKEIINWFDTNKFKKFIKRYKWINNNGALEIYLKYEK